MKMTAPERIYHWPYVAAGLTDYNPEKVEYVRKDLVPATPDADVLGRVSLGDALKIADEVCDSFDARRRSALAEGNLVLAADHDKHHAGAAEVLGRIRREMMRAALRELERGE
jgi:hypothetical protein